MQPTDNQSFYRGSDRILCGVCSGLAEGFHVEALWVRLAFVVLTFMNGVGLLLYVVLWVLMPERTGYRPTSEGGLQSMGKDIGRAWADLRAQFSGTSPAPQSVATATTTATASPSGSAAAPSGEAAPAATPVAQRASRSPSFILGAILIVIGIAFLASNLNIVKWSIIWPAALVALGIALLVRNMGKRS